jgi:hypothetical protein
MMEKEFEIASAVLSVNLTLKLKVPEPLVVPVINPASLSVKPAGSEPENERPGIWRDAPFC